MNFVKLHTDTKRNKRYIQFNLYLFELIIGWKMKGGENGGTDTKPTTTEEK